MPLLKNPKIIWVLIFSHKSDPFPSLILLPVLVHVEGTPVVAPFISTQCPDYPSDYPQEGAYAEYTETTTCMSGCETPDQGNIQHARSFSAGIHVNNTEMGVFENEDNQDIPYLSNQD